MKNKRQIAILKLIEDNEIGTQGALQEKLEEIGFEVTQTTISRDIRELKLIKGQTDRGTYKYILPGSSSEGRTGFNSAILSSVRKIDLGMNICVIRTHAGMANAVAVCVDSLSDENVLGSVAGDDTIMIALRTVEAAEAFAERLHNVFGI